MVEPCENCGCGLVGGAEETKTETIPVDMDFEKAVRDYVLDQLGLDQEDTFLQKVEICPGTVEVTYE